MSLILAGCHEFGSDKKEILSIFSLPNSFKSRLLLLPDSAGLMMPVSRVEFDDLKKIITKYSDWNTLDKSSTIGAQGLSISGAKGEYLYCVGSWHKGLRKVLIYDEKNGMFYAVLSQGLM
jgi:hypothetical protein